MKLSFDCDNIVVQTRRKIDQICFYFILQGHTYVLEASWDSLKVESYVFRNINLIERGKRYDTIF